MADTAVSPPSRADGLAEYASLLDRVEARKPVDGGVTRLVDAAVAAAVRPGFDTLVSLPRLRFKPFEHQVRVAEVVLRQMHGWAILGDEAGVGKTIEAGLVLSELRARGLASRVAVLAPAGLIAQWQEELERKFGLPTTTVSGPTGLPLRDSPAPPPIALVALMAARRPPLRDALTDTRWDVVIVDGAHHLLDSSSASARLVRDLRTRHLLLLTATPVVREAEDLNTLADLVSPGLLRTSRDGNVDAARVMVRHRRADVSAVMPPPRTQVEVTTVAPGSAEQELYRVVADRVRREGRSAAPAHGLALLSALRLAESSPRGVLAAADKLGWDDLGRIVGPIGRPAKADGVVEVVRRHMRRGEKVLVFTAFRRTLTFVTGVLATAGIDSAVYHSGLSREQKDQAVRSFRGPVDVLISTEAGGEGRNLRFCNVVVNFDLPWNPMHLARRVGRLLGAGKHHDVTVANLACGGTIEERLLHLFHTKLKLFDLTVGEVDQVLGRIAEDYDFERFVFDAHLSSSHDGDLAASLERLADAVAAARQEYELSKEINDTLIGPLSVPLEGQKAASDAG